MDKITFIISILRHLIHTLSILKRLIIVLCLTVPINIVYIYIILFTSKNQYPNGKTISEGI